MPTLQRDASVNRHIPEMPQNSREHVLNFILAMFKLTKLSILFAFVLTLFSIEIVTAQTNVFTCVGVPTQFSINGSHRTKWDVSPSSGVTIRRCGETTTFSLGSKERSATCVNITFPSAGQFTVTYNTYNWATSNVGSGTFIVTVGVTTPTIQFLGPNSNCTGVSVRAVPCQAPGVSYIWKDKVTNAQIGTGCGPILLTNTNGVKLEVTGCNNSLPPIIGNFPGNGITLSPNEQTVCQSDGSVFISLSFPQCVTGGINWSSSSNLTIVGGQGTPNAIFQINFAGNATVTVNANTPFGPATGNASVNIQSNGSPFCFLKVASKDKKAIDEQLEGTAETKPNTPIVNTTVGESRIGIYPNPVSTTLNISNLESAKTVRITDMLGKTMEQTELSENQATWQVNVSKFSNGTYIVQTIAKDGTISNAKVQIMH